MTSQQIELVKSSWSKVALIPTEAVGDLFYNRLFEIAPEVKPMFKNISIEEQSRKLLSMLAYVINKLDKLEDIIAEVQKLAQRHVAYAVKESHYAAVGSALLWTLEQGLQELFTSEVKTAWIECYTILSGAMIKASYATEVA
jgi:hemoglobin-like flavoprotein